MAEYEKINEKVINPAENMIDDDELDNVSGGLTQTNANHHLDIGLIYPKASNTKTSQQISLEMR